MAGSTRPSFPAPSEPSLRRLGVGGGGGGGDRPLRAQLVVALMVIVVLLAVPLYLWRRPSGTENAPANSAGDASPDGVASGNLPPGVAPGDAAAEDERVKLAPAERVKCSAAANSKGQEGELCDRIEVLEAALAKAIRDNVDCAPRTGKQGNLNYVLSIDFNAKKVHVFPGKSGEWRGPQARKAAECVKRSLPAPEWDKLKHQYRYYLVAILATYPAPGSAPGSAPLFE
ncbi:MAG TPA: hypothetical protein PKA88_00495 [Polyangiaceae bacterium]|nr:hypothetical protein [Polyangiaceae bacterium]